MSAQDHKPQQGDSQYGLLIANTMWVLKIGIENFGQRTPLLSGTGAQKQLKDTRARGPRNGARLGNPLKLGKEGWGALERRGKTWFLSDNLRRHRNPKDCAIQYRSRPRKRERFETTNNRAVDVRRPRDNTQKQAGQ
jgi:hypothetical protein